jgi:hypothetical protein
LLALLAMAIATFGRDNRNPTSIGRDKGKLPYARPVADLTQAAPLAGAEELIGNRLRLTYHRPTCPSLNTMRVENRVRLRTPARAQELGYRACTICTPPHPTEDLSDRPQAFR